MDPNNEGEEVMMYPPGIEYLEYVGCAVLWVMWATIVFGIPAMLITVAVRKIKSRTDQQSIDA